VVSMSGDWRQVHTPSRSSTTRSRRLEAVDAVVDNSAAGQARTENGINNGATHPLSVRSRPRTPLTFGIRYCFLASPDVHALWITSEWAKSGVWKTALFLILLLCSIGRRNSPQLGNQIGVLDWTPGG